MNNATEELNKIRDTLFATSALAGGCGCLCLILGGTILGILFLLLL